MSPSITCTSLAFTWPDGTAVLEGLDVAFGPGRTGLVGEPESVSGKQRRRRHAVCVPR